VRSASISATEQQVALPRQLCALPEQGTGCDEVLQRVPALQKQWAEGHRPMMSSPRSSTRGGAAPSHGADVSGPKKQVALLRHLCALLSAFDFVRRDKEVLWPAPWGGSARLSYVAEQRR